MKIKALKILILSLFSINCLSQDCPDSLDTSPGNSNGTIEFVIFDEYGNAIDTVICEQTGNGGSTNIDCGNLEDSTNSNFSYGVITLNNGTECAYNSDGELINPNLPIQLIEFKGYSDNEINILEWSTMSEKNNDYFTIEKSQNGIHWSLLDVVDASGNSSSKKTYLIVDKDPFPMTSYYRLRQTDYDGESETFDIISVENESDVFYVYTIKNKDNTIYFSEKYKFEIYDFTGKLVSFGESNKFDGSNIKSGIYILKIGLYTQKIYF